MKAKRHNRGSVLMEFIIVFPIYLVLFGGVFMVGDILVKATRLASADRVLSFDQAQRNPQGWNFVIDDDKGLFPHSQTGGYRETDLVRNDDARKYQHYSDSSFNGPWTLCVGAKAKDRYKLASWTKGWLNFALGFIDRTIHANDLPSDDFGRPLYGGNRHDAIYAKYEPVSGTRDYTYNYYTYRRTRDYEPKDLPKLYRAMPSSLEEAGRLVDNVADAALWNIKVVGEKYAEWGNDEFNTRSGPPSALVNREYKRYTQFVTWSD